MVMHGRQENELVRRFKGDAYSAETPGTGIGGDGGERVPGLTSARGLAGEREIQSIESTHPVSFSQNSSEHELKAPSQACVIDILLQSPPVPARLPCRQSQQQPFKPPFREYSPSATNSIRPLSFPPLPSKKYIT